MASNGRSSNGGTVSTDSSYDRELTPGEPTEPTSCVIATADGRRVECAITRKDRSTWVARPPEPHRFTEGDRFLIDRLPAGGTVEFADVLGPGEQDWAPGRAGGRADGHPVT
jgi:hypothetical protein